ncbi:FAD-dependent oxidoreductase [Pusillimonas sp. ANT_WB101]|uniref:FAD-dependent oxidoreductase n=1 Tax=Pusillimonas sp. ANT_WB101 TaxID=2597356 RepID=UPI0011ED8F16|nr:FAD-dependent oxidoreductase [Pusillimonas sp. ANT_WB101]KAA0892866.1 hypothetical protein FQ179_11350 [Pusillimonas sp. ANT_WB101]
MKRLLLIGGGHAHLEVLDQLRRRPVHDVRITLMSSSPRQVYTGMLPGLVAGRFSLQQASIDLAELCAQVDVEWVPQTCSELDLKHRTAITENDEQFPFTWVSLNIGSGPQLSIERSEHSTFVPIKPAECFYDAWEAFVARAAAASADLSVLVAGAGAGGTELVLAMRDRLDGAGLNKVSTTLVGSDERPLSGGFPTKLRKSIVSLLHRHKIDYIPTRRVISASEGFAQLDDGTRRPANFCALAAGASPSPWLGDSGLAIDNAGYVRVDRYLRSVSHHFVFAAGDVSAHPDQPGKSGVYAVRAGQALTESLYDTMGSRPLKAWKPQKRTLYLITLPAKRAMLSWGPLWASGAWAYLWKQFIDTRYMKRFPHPAPNQQSSLHE